jgi:hypothetical protein
VEPLIPFNVREAADAALEHIAKRNGGIPRTLAECRALPAAYGIGLRHDGGSVALLSFDVRGRPTILYDAYASPWTQMCGIVHEIVEFMLLGEFPLLTDLMYPSRFYRDGQGAPADARHLAAKYAELRYREWLDKNG